MAPSLLFSADPIPSGHPPTTIRDRPWDHRPRPNRTVVLIRPPLAIIAGFMLLAPVMVLSADWLNDEFWIARMLYAGLIWSYSLVGLLLWLRRPSNPMGMLILLVGIESLLSSLGFWEATVPQLVAAMCGSLTLAGMVHVLIAFPTGRVHGRIAGLTVALGYFTSTVLEASVYLFEPSDGPWLPIAERASWAEAGELVQKLFGIATVALALVVLVSRARRVNPTIQRMVRLLYAYGVFAVLMVPGSHLVVTVLLDRSAVESFTVQAVILAGVPVAYLTVLMNGHFARTGDLENLGTWLASGSADGRLDLARPVAAVLGDPSVRVLLRDSHSGAWLDPQGQVIEGPVPGGGRQLRHILVNGRRVGAIEYEPASVDDPEMVAAAGRMLGIAVDRERLVAELLAVQNELRESRLRLLEAENNTRRRVARDLHDGVQGRLVLLGIQAQQIARLSGIGPEAASAAVALRTGIDDTAAELRGLIQGVMPSMLLERGLGAGVADLLDRFPLDSRVQIDLDERRLCPAVESAAWFMLSEALANVLKHANAKRVDVHVLVRSDVLMLLVRDDGLGGAEHFTDGRPLAQTSRSPGTGLLGLAERIDVVGGTLTVDSGPHGTTICAHVPLQTTEGDPR